MHVRRHGNMPVYRQKIFYIRKEFIDLQRIIYENVQRV